jgi:hypothetical protein
VDGAREGDAQLGARDVGVGGEGVAEGRHLGVRLLVVAGDREEERALGREAQQDLPRGDGPGRRRRLGTRRRRMPPGGARGSFGAGGTLHRGHEEVTGEGTAIIRRAARIGDQKLGTPRVCYTAPVRCLLPPPTTTTRCSVFIST